jgi:hypothetical protein
MRIEIYAEWDGMTGAERNAQAMSFDGIAGYLQEVYHGEPYATKRLFPEAFMFGRAEITASSLAKRLPEVLAIVETRVRDGYDVAEPDPKSVDAVLKEYRDFVALCAQKEYETGHPCLIIANC